MVPGLPGRHTTCLPHPLPSSQIVWYLDGTRFYSVTSGNGVCNDVQGKWCSLAAGAAPDAPFDRPFHLLLDLALGSPTTAFTQYDHDGNPATAPIGVTEQQLRDTLTGAAPAQMRVDYVRIYRCAADDDGTCYMPTP